MHGYGIALYFHTSDCLIEDNIFRNLRHSLSFQCGANGNVVGYNYSRDPNRSEFPANYGADISMHGHYSYANLFEGNIVQNIQLDQTWGPSTQHVFPKPCGALRDPDDLRHHAIRLPGIRRE
jgi:hypothetical protein